MPKYLYAMYVANKFLAAMAPLVMIAAAVMSYIGTNIIYRNTCVVVMYKVTFLRCFSWPVISSK